MEVSEYDELGKTKHAEPLFEVFGGEDERKIRVETNGEFLWPRERGPNGRWYGFDQETWVKRSLNTLTRIHFRAQYYNDPHDVDNFPNPKKSLPILRRKLPRQERK